MKNLTRVFFGIWSLLFIFSAYLQLNDIDPWTWVSIYLIAAILSAFAAMERYPIAVLVILTALCLIGTVYYFPPSVSEWVSQEWEQKDLTMKTLAMEEAREAFGLLLIAIVLSLAAIVGWRRKNDARGKYGGDYFT